ncbi:hypothetical protein B0H17DRAFT_1128175 [Mycena rosella]|uniref:Uncharacterized protein n=1 Tax=Mycena rosella TaxID=1033263 RepID=A0AAD7GR58_MYCRO|nr:hypothetical protein B0H17DRAFT_1128175 [Mycena rosella]
MVVLAIYWQWECTGVLTWRLAEYFPSLEGPNRGKLAFDDMRLPAFHFISDQIKFNGHVPGKYVSFNTQQTKAFDDDFRSKGDSYLLHSKKFGDAAKKPTGSKPQSKQTPKPDT